MSNPWAQNPLGPYRFRESLRFEDVVRLQILKCAEALSSGYPDQIMYAVETLDRLISPNLSDDEYVEQLIELDNEWKAELAQKQKEYRKRLFAARHGCPDLVEKPVEKPDVDHWKKLFEICLAVLERKGLGLKNQTEESL